MKDILRDRAEGKQKGQERGQIKGYTVKKVMVFPSPDGMSLTNHSWPGRHYLVTSRLETGKRLTFFLQCRTEYKLKGQDRGQIKGTEQMAE